MEALCIEFITQCNQDLAQETWYTIYKLPTNAKAILIEAYQATIASNPQPKLSFATTQSLIRIAMDPLFINYCKKNNRTNFIDAPQTKICCLLEEGGSFTEELYEKVNLPAQHYHIFYAKFQHLLCLKNAGMINNNPCNMDMINYLTDQKNYYGLQINGNTADFFVKLFKHNVLNGCDYISILSNIRYDASKKYMIYDDSGPVRSHIEQLIEIIVFLNQHALTQNEIISYLLTLKVTHLQSVLSFLSNLHLPHHKPADGFEYLSLKQLTLLCTNIPDIIKRLFAVPLDKLITYDPKYLAIYMQYYPTDSVQFYDLNTIKRSERNINMLFSSLNSWDKASDDGWLSVGKLLISHIKHLTQSQCEKFIRALESLQYHDRNKQDLHRWLQDLILLSDKHGNNIFAFGYVFRECRRTNTNISQQLLNRITATPPVIEMLDTMLWLESSAIAYEQINKIIAKFNRFFGPRLITCNRLNTMYYYQKDYSRLGLVDESVIICTLASLNLLTNAIIDVITNQERTLYNQQTWHLNGEIKRLHRKHELNEVKIIEMIQNIDKYRDVPRSHKLFNDFHYQAREAKYDLFVPITTYPVFNTITALLGDDFNGFWGTTIPEYFDEEFALNKYKQILTLIDNKNFQLFCSTHKIPIVQNDYFQILILLNRHDLLDQMLR